MTPEEQQGLEDRLIAGAMLQAENAAVDRFKSALREEIENDRDFNTSDEVGEYYDGMRKAYYRTLKLLDTITTEK